MKWKTTTSDFIPTGSEVKFFDNDTGDLVNDGNEENPVYYQQPQEQNIE